MARKEYDPAIAARIKKSTYDYYVNLAKRRGETLTDVVRAAIYCYEIKIRDIQERWEEVK